MSNKKKSNQANTAPLIATIVVALAAIAAVIVLLVISGSKDGDSEPVSDKSGFSVTAELIEECSDNASDLVRQNYEIIKLFVTEGLPKKAEPYGNEPEDGIYTVDSAEYTKLSQIEELVRSVYVDGEADRVLHRMGVTLKDGSTALMEVYKNREVFGETFLGIDARFIPDANYSHDWSNCFVEIQPMSETVCEITVYVNGISAEEASAHPESVLKTEMVKQDGNWRLSQVLL